MSTNCTFYDPTTGEITSVCELSDETLGYYVSEGAHALLDVRGDSSTHYVINNELIAYTSDEVAAKASMPSGFAWKMPERIVVDMRPIDEVKVGHILAVDSMADLARLGVVGDAARIKEYERAQQHAEAYQASGWALEPVPASVASWAAAKGWSSRQAAEDILAASARWLGALDYIRTIRLMAKENIKRAASNSEADTILSTFKATLTAAMQGIA